MKTWPIFPKHIELLYHYYCCYGKVLKWHPKMGHQFSKHSQIWRALFQIHIGVVFWFKNDLSLVNKKTYLKDDERWGTIIRWSCINKIPGFSNYACWSNGHVWPHHVYNLTMMIDLTICHINHLVNSNQKRPSLVKKTIVLINRASNKKAIQIPLVKKLLL